MTTTNSAATSTPAATDADTVGAAGKPSTGSSPGPDDTSTSDDTTGTDDTGSAPNAEAARYRTRLRAAETKRDTLADRVDTLQQREAERLVADRLAQPGDLLGFGATLADVLDPGTGDVDPDRIDDLLGRLLAERPGLAKVPPRAGPRPDLSQGQVLANTSGRGWADIIKGPR